MGRYIVPADHTNFFKANPPSNQFFNLSPLFSSANNPLDIESVQVRGRFGNERTNAPTIAIESTNRLINRLFMNDADVDEMGIRVSPPNFVFTTNNVSRWFGTGILDKPIGDFHQDTVNPFSSQPYFGDVRVTVHSRVIPEPAEYALVLGLLALAFGIVRRRFQKIA